MCARQGDRPALHSLHVRQHRAAEGCRARQRRAHGGAHVDDAEHLRRRAGRRVLVRVRRGLGGRPFLHHLRPPSERQHDHHLRGQARRHTRCRRVLACDLGVQGGGVLHRPHGASSHQEGGSDGKPDRDLRSYRLAHVVPRGRACRSRYGALGGAGTRHSRDRPLVADGDGLGDRGQPDRARSLAGEARLADSSDAGLRHPHSRRGWARRAAGATRKHRRQAAVAAGLSAFALECGRAFRPELHRPFPRLLQDRRRGLPR